MITISYDRFTIECATLDEAQKQIKIQKVPLQEAVIKFRAQVPGIAFDEVVKDVQGSGGRIL
jgi:hypothetical protein